MAKVLFVCLGNICRSPAAEGMLRHMAAKKELEELIVKSCGIGDWHIGQLPDERMREAAQSRGLTLSSRAQKFHPQFLDEFDFILAADHEVLNNLYHYAKLPEHKAKIHLITEFSGSYKGQEIPDPYYASSGSFDLVLDMLEDSCEGLLFHIRGPGKTTQGTKKTKTT